MYITNTMYIISILVYDHCIDMINTWIDLYLQ